MQKRLWIIVSIRVKVLAENRKKSGNASTVSIYICPSDISLSVTRGRRTLGSDHELLQTDSSATLVLALEAVPRH